MENVEKLIHDYMEKEYINKYSNFEIQNVSIEGNIISCEEHGVAEEWVESLCYTEVEDVSKVINVTIDLLELLGFTYSRIPVITVR